jgi:DNA replication licensing factor MCM2
MFVIISPR